MNRIYLDYASTTPTEEAVLQAMAPFFTEVFGNPSSVHSFGREARDAVEKARRTIASFIGAQPHEIVFTSGGTESDNAAIKGVAHALRTKGNHVITTSIEHHAVLEPCEFLEGNGYSVTYLPVDSSGFVDPDAVRKAIRPRTVLVSVMHANNEVGTVEPIAEIGRVAREHGIAFHTDAVQTFGHLPVNVDDLGVDLLSASAHKLYGPKGVGSLYIRSGTKWSPFMHGGSQEKGRRASTLNVPGIVGFGKAVELAAPLLDQEISQLTRLRDRLIGGILSGIKRSRLNGHATNRLPANVNVSFRNVEGELLLQQLDEEGVASSTGSACSAESKGPSHVLSAIGLPGELVAGSIRFSLGRRTTPEEIDRVLEILPGAVREIRRMTESLDS